MLINSEYLPTRTPCLQHQTLHGIVQSGYSVQPAKEHRQQVYMITHPLHLQITEAPFQRKEISKKQSATISASSLAGVVGFAIGALVSHDMEWHFRICSTVIAKDPYHFILIKIGHRCNSNLHVKFLPHL